MSNAEHFLRNAIELAYDNLLKGGKPFGAVVVREGSILATGVNEVLITNDPTSHAEMNALRAASQELASPHLTECEVFASGHPCPMCLAAMRMSGIREVTYAYSNEAAEPYGLSTAAIYADLARPFAEQTMTIRHHPLIIALLPNLYVAWKQQQEKG